MSQHVCTSSVDAELKALIGQPRLIVTLTGTSGLDQGTRGAAMTLLVRIIRSRPVQAALAFPINVLGLTLFFWWLMQTDFLFGHFTGPPPLLYASTCVLALGIMVSFAWYANALYDIFRQRERTRRRGAGIITGIFLFILLVPTCLGLFLAASASIEEILRPSVEDLVNMSPVRPGLRGRAGIE